MRKKILNTPVLLLFIFLIALPAYSEKKMRIVVMNMKADGVPERTARTVSNMLRTEFINLGDFIVVERAQMNMILKEQGLQQSGRTDQECVVQMGRLMSAKKIMVGEVSPMGKTIIMTVRIVDVEKGVSEFAATQKAKSEDVLDVTVGKITRKIASRIKGEKRYDKRTEVEDEPADLGGLSSAGYYFRGFIPGWGQLYINKPVKGFIYLGVFATTGVLTFMAMRSWQSDKDSYDSLTAPGPTATLITENQRFNSAYQDYEDASSQFQLMAMILMGVYVFNWLDILFLSAPNFDKNFGQLHNEKNYVSFNFNRTSIFSREKNMELSYVMRF